MGCRHAQSILSGIYNAKVFVIEENQQIFQANLDRIGSNDKIVTLLSDLNNLNVTIDFCVIATSAQPRFEIIKTLIEKDIKYFLVEKVVFQSERQFDQIINLLAKNNAVAYCNFVNRYYANYQSIKSNLHKTPLKMIVKGGDFGLACNALHYVDLFEYLTKEKSILVKSQVFKNENGNKRGNQYIEVFGMLSYTNSNGSILSIISEKDLNSIEILICQDEKSFIIDENVKKQYSIYLNENIVIDEFKPIQSSTLASKIVLEILNGNCILPTIQETKNCHVQLFEVVNNIIGLKKTDLCPIT